ncbi:hypothetical protein KKH36_04145 [Patescibacteria group bacterium]|nr:hypothetical protein [Patescibacteria group bacterium]
MVKKIQPTAEKDKPVFPPKHHTKKNIPFVQKKSLKKEEEEYSKKILYS